MKIPILDQTNNKKGEIELPSQFTESVREDLIHRAVITIQSNKRQPYGAAPEAGKRSSSIVSKRRRKYRGSYGIGISRTPRKVMSRSGTRMNWVGAFAPNTVGGRRAHPPKSKDWTKKLNKKERRKAIRSAMAATLIIETVKQRGHHLPKGYPFAIDASIESFTKTKDILGMLDKLGLNKELKRAKEKSIRAGKGKVRGRKYIKKKGPLIVISKKGKIIGAAKNIPGVEVVEVRSLNAELLAPGAVPGRLTIWSSAAIETLEKEKLFN